jgi:WD40 repeat protein
MSYEYRVGGSLSPSHPTYVERQADKDLLQALQSGHFCYVFNSRQMGKSSLRVRVIYQLQAAHSRCVSVDMTALGSDGQESQWYNGLIQQLFLGLNLVGKINLKLWLKDRENYSGVQKLGQFLEEILLDTFPEDTFYIFFDEIDKTLSLPFLVDDFFSLIRFCYNQRADNPQYNRLVFTLLGVATPTDLIREKTQTSFNIGYPIELTGFTLAEITPLEQGLQFLTDKTNLLLEEILYWTGGQPFLTQKICQLIVKYTNNIEVGKEKLIVQSIIHKYILKNWESQDEPVHLKTIRDRLLYQPHKASRLLGLYQTLLKNGFLSLDSSPEQTDLRLSGLVVSQQNKLVIYNPIYASVFNLDWLQKELNKLRPYSESLLAWEGSSYQDESRLLRGIALEEALYWAQGKNLSDLDYKFLSASQSFDRKEIIEAQKILLDAQEKAQKKIKLGSIFLTLSGLIVTLSIGWASYSSQQRYIIQKSLELQQEAKSAQQKFSQNQILGLITAMQSVQELQSLASGEVLEAYPTRQPLLILEQLLGEITQNNIILAHEQGINSVSISPDNTKIATASEDGTAKLWTISGEFIVTLTGHQGAVYSVAFSPKNSLVATASQDKTVKTWDLEGNLKTTFLGHTEAVYSVTFTGDGEYLATTSKDKTIRIWDKLGNLKQVLKGHIKSVDDVSFSPDGKQLVTASRDGSIRVWEKGQEVQRLAENQASFYSVVFSPDGRWLAAANRDETVWLWSRDGKLKTKLKGHQGLVNSVVFSPNSQYLATASNDGSVKVWNLQGKVMKTLTGEQKGFLDVAWSHDSKNVLGAGADGSLLLWRGEKILRQLATQTIPSLSGIVGQANFTGNYGAIATRNRQLYIVDKEGEIISKFPLASPWLDNLAVSEERVAATDNSLTIWDHQGRELQTLMDDYAISAVALAGKKVWSGNRQGVVKEWNLKTNQPLRILEVYPQQRIIWLTLTRDGKFLATVGEGGEVKIYETVKLTLIHSLPKSETEVLTLAFRPDGGELALGYADGSLHRLNMSTKSLQVFKQESVPITSLNYSADGQFLATGSENGSLRVWSQQGGLLWEAQDNYQGIAGLTFLQKKPELFVIYRDGTLDYQPWYRERRLSQLLEQGCLWLQDYYLANSTREQGRKLCQN